MNCYVSPYMDEEMKISQMIESLIAIMDANGDLEVETTFLTGDRVAAREPVSVVKAVPKEFYWMQSHPTMSAENMAEERESLHLRGS